MLTDLPRWQAITREVAEATELDDALEAALRGFCEATGWDYGEVWLAPLPEHVGREEAPELTLAATWHGDRPALARFRDESASGGGFERGEGLVGRVWSSGDPRSVANVSEDPRYRRASAAREAGLKEALALPLVARDETAGVMVFYREESGTGGEELVVDAASLGAQLGAIVREKQVREQLERERSVLAERVKEQSCLYDVATILRDGERSLEERLSAVVDRIPPGWQHPEATVGRLVMGGREFTSGAWPEEGPTLSAPVETAEARVGRLEVRYRDERPEEDIGPFLEEERRLLEEIADRIGAELAQFEAYRELEETEERLRLLTENVDAVLYHWDTSVDPPGFLYVSSAYEGIWGRPVEELYDEPMAFVEAMVPEDRERFREIVDDRWSSPIEVTYRIRRPDGSVRWIRDQSFPVEAEEGGGSRLIGLAEDVTEQKRLERRLRQSNRDLEQFAYVASHDLQEPLRMVSGYLQLVDERYGDRLDEDGREFIDYAVDGALRMKKMIADLLDYSRVSTRGEEPAPVDAGSTLDQALTDLGVLIEEAGAEVIRDELPTVMADENQLVRVFQNLVANALRHGGEGVRVEVTTERDGDRWRFSVADDGPGIPAEQHARIFEIFESLQRPDGQQSTGIGLAVCRRIVERHGGRIWVESEPGEGATFHFTMPAVGTTGPDASEAGSEERERRGTDER